MLANAESGELLYERVAQHVTSLIDSGALRAGDRLPSVRRLSRQQHVSVSTVLQAYVLLENRGLVEARPQSGHYVRAARAVALAEPRPVRPSATPAKIDVSDLVGRVYRATRDPSLVQLGAAMPAPELLPTRKLNAILATLARESGGLGVAYEAPPGFGMLRRSVARRAAEWGVALSPDELITTSGAMEALHLALRAVTRAGDAVAVETPIYYGILQLLESLELRACEVPAHARTGMDLDALEGVLRSCNVKAVLSVTNFSNPLGSLMPDESKERLVAMLARREIPLIEDDIYGELHFGPARPCPAKAFDKKGLVLLCSSFSKTLAPGYRVGWIAPGRFRDQVERLKFATSIATATLPQMAIAEFLENGGYDHHLRQLRRKLKEQLDQYTEEIARRFPEGTRVSRPAGGVVLWVELPPGTSALQLHARALEYGIAIVPGPLFSAKGRFESCVRLSAARPFTETIARAVRTVGDLAAR